MALTLLSNYARSPGDPKIIKSGPGSMDGADRMARALGWFGLGLGIVEIIAARRIARTLGMEEATPLVRAYGAREIVSGAITLSPDKEIGLWSRVAGDTLDMATLARGLDEDNPKRGNVKLAMIMVLGITALDVLTAAAVTARSRRATDPKTFNYRDRSGFPKGIEESRQSAARSANGSGRPAHSSSETSPMRGSAPQPAPAVNGNPPR